MKFKILIIMTTIFHLLLSESEFDFKGQLVGSPGINYNDNFKIFGTIQYLPMLEYENFQQNFNHSFDIAANLMSNFESETEAKLYRLKFAIANDHSELRVGLQKINFGPAQILRSLQWFDTMSPTDPLKLTDGVYGALFRHYFLNNNNIWIWSLYGNNDLKGIEFTETKDKTFEFGGRSQITLFHGEVGLTFHSRKISDSHENKYAIDGRWDYIVGSWFETVFQSSEAADLFMMTIGMDYTFSIGNGLYITGEHMFSSMENHNSNFSNDIQYSSLMASYPISLFDNLNVISHYSWEKSEISQYFGWQRTYDNFIYNFNLFYYPKYKNNINFQNKSGYGFEFKLIYNH